MDLDLEIERANRRLRRSIHFNCKEMNGFLVNRIIFKFMPLIAKQIELLN